MRVNLDEDEIGPSRLNLYVIILLLHLWSQRLNEIGVRESVLLAVAPAVIAPCRI